MKTDWEKERKFCSHRGWASGIVFVCASLMSGDRDVIALKGGRRRGILEGQRVAFRILCSTHGNVLDDAPGRKMVFKVLDKVWTVRSVASHAAPRISVTLHSSFLKLSHYSRYC